MKSFLGKDGLNAIKSADVNMSRCGRYPEPACLKQENTVFSYFELR